MLIAGALKHNMLTQLQFTDNLSILNRTKKGYRGQWRSGACCRHIIILVYAITNSTQDINEEYHS